MLPFIKTTSAGSAGRPAGTKAKSKILNNARQKTFMVFLFQNGITNQARDKLYITAQLIQSQSIEATNWSAFFRLAEGRQDRFAGTQTHYLQKRPHDL